MTQSLSSAESELQAITRERDQLRALLNQAPAIVASLQGPTHVYTYLNPLYQQVIGRHRDVLGKPISEALPELAGQGIYELLDQVYTTGEPYRGSELKVMLDRRDDGTLDETYFDFTYQPLRDAEGAITGVLVHGTEVTDRVVARLAADREMAEQRALTERIIQNAPAGIAFLDGDLVYRRLNDAYAYLMGMSVEQVLDKSIYEVFPGATDQFEPLMRRVMETGEPYVTTSFPFRFMLDGEEKITYWDFTYQPVLDSQGRVGILILEVEVSDRMERERLHHEQMAHLRAMDQYKDQFLSVISHELRTPLNFIMGFASLLEDEVPGPLNEQQQGAVSRILNGSDRMLKLVDDLLDIAKLQSDRFELAIEPTAYGPLVDEVAGLLRPLVDQRGLRLAADVAVPGTPAFDPARISQVLTNLLGNAIKFTDEGGTVAVRAYVDGDALVTQVMDTGVGIASDDIPKLFNRFQQLDMTNTRQAGGTGLGLAISKALVEAHGGTIGVESMPDAGSTFWFRLPLRGA